MSSVPRRILLWVLGYSWLACLAGLGLMAVIVFSIWQASGHAYAERDKLTTVTGAVTQASKVTETRKSRRGSTRATNTYYELTVAGHAKPLRIDTYILRQDLVAALIDEPIVALVDPGEHNLVYEVAMQNGPTLIRYEGMRDRLNNEAQRMAKDWNDVAVWLGAMFLTLLGGAGLWFRHRLRK